MCFEIQKIDKLTSSFSETCGDKDCGCFRLASCFSWNKHLFVIWNSCRESFIVAVGIRTQTHHFLLYNLLNFSQITLVECFTVGWIGRLNAVIVADNLRCVLNRFHRWWKLKALERILNLLGMLVNWVEGWGRSREWWSYGGWRWWLGLFFLLVLRGIKMRFKREIALNDSRSTLPSTSYQIPSWVPTCRLVICQFCCERVFSVAEAATFFYKLTKGNFYCVICPCSWLDSALAASKWDLWNLTFDPQKSFHAC